jgi:hypothetical protein
LFSFKVALLAKFGVFWIWLGPDRVFTGLADLGRSTELIFWDCGDACGCFISEDVVKFEGFWKTRLEANDVEGWFELLVLASFIELEEVDLVEGCLFIDEFEGEDWKFWEL